MVDKLELVEKLIEEIKFYGLENKIETEISDMKSFEKEFFEEAIHGNYFWNYVSIVSKILFEHLS